jgi:hypothetical protein
MDFRLASVNTRKPLLKPSHPVASEVSQTDDHNLCKCEPPIQIVDLSDCQDEVELVLGNSNSHAQNTELDCRHPMQVNAY